jgi:hypothetical protein
MPSNRPLWFQARLLEHNQQLLEHAHTRGPQRRRGPRDGARAHGQMHLGVFVTHARQQSCLQRLLDASKASGPAGAGWPAGVGGQPMCAATSVPVLPHARGPTSDRPPTALVTALLKLCVYTAGPGRVLDSKLTQQQPTPAQGRHSTNAHAPSPSPAAKSGDSIRAWHATGQQPTACRRTVTRPQRLNAAPSGHSEAGVQPVTTDRQNHRASQEPSATQLQSARDATGCLWAAACMQRTMLCVVTKQ